MSILLKITLLAVATVAVAGQSSSSTGSGPVVPATRPATQSICDYYTLKFGAATQKKFVSDLLEGAISGEYQNRDVPNTPGIFAQILTAPYFDGSKQYRVPSNPTYNLPSNKMTGIWAGKTPNFSDNQPAGILDWLGDHLIPFFGSSGVLGCTAADFPAYTPLAVGVTQTQIHSNMNITAATFAAFNNQVTSVATFAGVSADDVNAITAALGSFGRIGTAPYSAPNVICQDADCPCATGYVQNAACDTLNAAASASFSVLALAVAAIVAILAQRA